MSRAALVLLGCSTFMGCILVRDPDYDSPRNTPPVVLEDPGYPMNRFRDVCLEECESSPDGGVESQVTFVAFVRDPDIDQELDTRVFLDHNPDSTINLPIINEIRIPPNGTAVRRIEFQVDKASLRGGACRVIELHVSRAFINVTNPVPAPDPDDPSAPVDLGRGTWFLRVLRNPDDSPSLVGCEATGGS